MNNTEKMAPVLKQAKLVRFQQTNQARINPIYDASLYVFSPRNAKNGSPGVDCPNQTVNKYLFTLDLSPSTHLVS